MAFIAGETGAGKSAAYKAQPREVILFIAGHIQKDAMRSHFLQSEDVSAVMA